MELAVAEVIGALHIAEPCQLQLEVGVFITHVNDDVRAVLCGLAPFFLQPQRFLMKAFLLTYLPVFPAQRREYRHNQVPVYPRQFMLLIDMFDIHVVNASSQIAREIFAPQKVSGLLKESLV